MAPRARIQPQAAGSDEEFIDIDRALGSNLDSDDSIARPDHLQSRNPNQSRSATGGAVGHRTDLEQVWRPIMLNPV